LRVNLLVNLFRPDAVSASRRIVKLLQSHEVEVYADHESCSEVGVPEVAPEQFGDAELVIAIGGDGTLIRAAYLVSERGTPIMGVHYGRFGFVTQVEPEQADEAIVDFLAGGCPIEERMMVKTELIRGSETVAELHALNEIVVQRSATTRMLTFDVHVDGSQVSRYPADGVMVSTPTGSTAYNLSAGGPVVDPRMDALILTAIMPHTLSSRPLVLRPESLIEIKVESREESVLSADGHSRLHLLSGDYVRITRSTRRTRLVCTASSDFFERLSDRLQWSQGSI
jgi:NAD+ kinase